MTFSQRTELEADLQRLESGTALPYVLGEWEFYGLAFKLTPASLIPRPETELLVEQALSWLKSRPGQLLAADIGTGSGCIAVALTLHHPSLRLLAVDLAWDALQVARVNLNRHLVSARVHLLQCDLIPPVSSHFDLICANLPYIPSAVLRTLPVARSEPRQALDGGKDGLDFIRRLLEGAPSRLAPGGLLLVEIESGQGQAVLDLALRSFPRAEVRLLPDLAGLDRLVQIST